MTGVVRQRVATGVSEVDIVNDGGDKLCLLFSPDFVRQFLHVGIEEEHSRHMG